MSESLEVMIIEYGAMSPRVRGVLESFRFSGLSDEHRQRDLLYDLDYNDRSVYVMVLHNDDIGGVARIITKAQDMDMLPIEYGRVIETVCKTVPAVLKTDVPVLIDPSILPVCEIGGLKISESLGMRLKCRVLDLIMKTCHAEIHRRKFTCFFLTSRDSPHMGRLYTDKVFFQEFARIRYGSEVWRALWRWPFTDDFLKDCFQWKMDRIPESAYKALPI